MIDETKHGLPALIEILINVNTELAGGRLQTMLQEMTKRWH